MRTTFFLIAALTLLLSCGGESITGPDGIVPIATVHRDRMSGIRQQRAEVISREARWREVWDEIMSTRSPKPPLPVVDFEQSILVLAALGETGDSCRCVRVDGIERRAGALDVRIASVRPETCTGPAVTVQPVHVVSLPRAASGVAYTWSNVTGSCPQ